MIGRVTGPDPYASSASTTEVRPIRAGVTVKGPFSGKSEHGHRSAGPGRRERQAAQSEIPHSKDGDVVARIERHHVRRQPAAGLEFDDGVLLTRDDVAAVTTRSGRAAQPVPSTPTSQAVPSTRTTLATHDALRPRAQAEDQAGRQGPAGPAMVGKGSIRASTSRTSVGETT